MTKPLLVLVDGSSYFFRAFHALPPLSNSKGQQTGAIYGVTNMIKKLIKDTASPYFAVVFDAKGKTFRDDLYPAYKAHRPPTPEALSSQFEPLVALLKALGLPVLIVPGVEADDVIGTLAKQAEAAGMSVLISTGDKDMAQLVNEDISLINTMSNQRLNPAAVLAKFGVRPDQIIDYLSLMGDSSDNVPGVSQCGPKTAAKWLNQYQNLDGLIASAAEISGKIGESLRAHLPEFPLTRSLVQIKTDVALDCQVQSLVIQAADQQQLLALYKDFEFKTWLKDLLAASSQNTSASPDAEPATGKPFSFRCLQDLPSFEAYLTELSQKPSFAVDTETTSLEACQAEIVGISLAFEPDAAVYIPLAHSEDRSQLDRGLVLAALKPLLEDPNQQKIGQNLKYDYQIFKNYGIHMQGIAFDSMIESYVLDSTSNQHDMDSLALKYLGYKTTSYTELTGKGNKQIPFAQVPIATAAAYAAEDAAICLQLHQKLYPKLDRSLQKVFHDIEMPLVPVLAEMEYQGVLIDCETLAIQGQRLKARIEALEQEAYRLAGNPFNMNSPKQLQQILFVEQNIPIIAKTPTGQASTAEPVLQELAYEYRLPAVILEYRGLAKLVSTYIDALPKRLNPNTKRVHSSYNQAVAATGRLSSSEPNLQNIPVRSEEGRMIRNAFIAPEGYCMLSADYSQIELRIMAHLAEEQNLILAFQQGLDIHAATAAEIFGLPLEAVQTEHRRKAKAVNFGLIYGMSAFGLAKQLGVSREDAKQYIDRYFQRYPGVLDYMERTRTLAHKQGYVETLLGRRLYLPEINSKNIQRQKAAERTAINAPMQGTAADIIKKAMLSIAAFEATQSPRLSRMIMQVHDELVFEVKTEALDSIQAAIQQRMEHCIELSVPLVVTIGQGKNWGEAH